MKPDTTLKESDVAKLFSALADEHAQKLQSNEGQRTLLRIQRTLAQRGRSKVPARRLAALTLVPALGAALLTFGLTVWFTPQPLSFEVEGAANHQGLIQTKAASAVLQFSDESRVVAKPHSSLNMSLVGEHGALARLSEGQLRVKVTHAKQTDWRFLAGPYEVRVVGTEFDLAYDSESSQLSVVMHEGRVRVVGPQKTETILNAGESRTFGPEPKSEPVASRHSEGSAPEPEAERPSAGPQVASRDRSVAKVQLPKPASWAKLVGKGRFAEVVQDAQQSGLDAALASRSSQELQALAQAAHYTGRGSLALKTWSTVRQRFGGQRVGRQAAFFMGRIYDQQGNAQSALKWLNIYLGEAGGDVYASEALGRKLTLTERLQGKAQARRVARTYLERFPKGAYARTAQALLDE